MRILFLMLDSEEGPWGKLFEEGAEQTWVHDLDMSDVYLRYVSTGNDYISKCFHPKLLNNRYNSKIWPLIETYNFMNRFKIDAHIIQKKLRIVTSERWSSINVKTLVALRYCLENFDFDFIIRGNATAFFNVKSLKKHLAVSTSKYFGPIHKNKPFASGWAIGLTKDAALALVRDFSLRDLAYFDDEAFGRVLAPVFACDPLPYLEISAAEDIEKYSPEFLAEIPAIRTKLLSNGCRLDAELQRKLYEYINGIKIEGRK